MPVAADYNIPCFHPLNPILATATHLWTLNLVVALDDIRISRRRSVRLPRTALSTLRRCSSSRRLSTLRLACLWLREAVVYAALLARKLSSSRLAAHGAIALSSTSRLLMRDNVVCGSSVAALTVGRYLLVCVVGIGVLQDHVPGVKEAG